ncbi:peptidoglycan-binding protein [Nodosilinea sp. LEGE 07088]|uniref:peptidoglycan-binding protein n=1 Tax=Nodosilinea sp. LEGE 07088 TaxID=2777968 RepID=UPI001881E4AE|nr:peptidoglycan-binding protein [Nodosilinea sp. LEGE 07088]MBE9139472.1 peptidoglycan-binding protein [Nodosilinea sp. LEGE 07088]
MFLVYTQVSSPPSNVRSQPNTSSQIIEQLDNETLVVVKQAVENGWLEIEQPVKGFIHGKLVQPEKPQFYRDKVGSVVAWQHLLNGCGYHPENAPRLVITGELDDVTVAVTKKFQQDMKLDPTGEVTDATWQVAFDHDKLRKWKPVEPGISKRHVPPPADTLSEAEKYDYCRQVIESHGGTFRDVANKRNLLSFRQETSTRENNWKGVYDDLTYMIWKDSNGGKHCLKFKSNTEPSSWFEDSNDPKAAGRVFGQDANNDGKKDLGRLQEGYYEYGVGKVDWADSINGFGNALMPTRYAMTVIRDIDHDGIFEDHEPLLGSGDMLFHTGSHGRTGSAGCQTMPPNVYQDFWTKLTANGNPGTVGYTIVRWKSL